MRRAVMQPGLLAAVLVLLLIIILVLAVGGGIRHSDTVVVTPDGIDVLTSYPKDIGSLTIPV